MNKRGITRTLYMRERAKERSKSGMCRDCDNQIGTRSKILCSDCLDRNLKNSKKYHKLFPVEQRFNGIKKRAKQKRIECSLTKQEFVKWYDAQTAECCYCGIDPARSNKKPSLTVDRKNNTEGYSINNICLACHRCNLMKNSFFSHAEWMEIAQKYIKPRLGEYHQW